MADDAFTGWEQYGSGASFPSDVEVSTDENNKQVYTIKTARGLAWVAYVTNYVTNGDNCPANAGFEGCIVKLGNDISLAQSDGSSDGVVTWIPIGVLSDCPFLGTFDGNNHVVTGLTVTRYLSVGLFGYVGSIDNETKKAGTICNLGVDGANVDGQVYAGALVGKLFGTMEKCWSSGSVKVTSPTEIPYGNVAAASASDNSDYSDTSNEEAAGGLVGEATDGSTISNCYSTAEVSALCTGGIVGVLHGTLEYCYATGKVTSSSETNSGPAGGICGFVSDGSIINNCIAMNVDGITGNTTGRIWGQGSITGSSNYASTKISGDTWTSDATGKDGEGVKYSGYISYVKNNWSQDVWTISNKHLPQLKDMSGQTELPRADYMQVDLVSITITPPSCGRIEVYEDGAKLEPDSENKIEVANGSTVTIKAVANSGYGFSWLKIDGVQQAGATVENYEVNDDITLSASFYYIIPNVFMYDDVCYEKSWDANYWEEVKVSPLKNYYNYDKNYIGDLDLPEKVIYSNDYGQAEFRLTAIADNAFEGSSALKSVAMPSTISKIGSYAFKGCTGLEKLVVKSPSAVTRSATVPAVPTVGEHAFDDICETAELYVPEGWKEAFKAAPEWNKLLNVKEQQQDGTVLAELTITASSGGTVSVGSLTSANDTKTLKVAEGTDVTVEVAAAEGYMLASLTCNGNDVIDQLVDGKLTLVGVNGEYSIDAVFSIDTGIGGNGTSPIKIGMKDGAISVEGVAKGEEIFIYNVSGNLLRREVAKGEPVEIAMTPGQVYIVKIGKQSFKLM